MPSIPNSDELNLKEYQLSCQASKNEKMKMLLIRQKLLVLNEKNENISKSLTNIKIEYELYRSHLHKTLFKQKVATEKQKILSRKKLNEFLESKKRAEEYIKMSPIKFELEELIKRNSKLQEECRKMADLFELTKHQHNELWSVLIKAFKSKLCEFCQTVLKHDSVKLRKIS